jgi:hypothetical protein
MAILIEDIRIKDKFRPSEYVNYTLYTIGEPYDIEIDFRVEETAIAETGTYDESGWISFEPSNFRSGIADNNKLFVADNPNAFANFFIGDKFKISSTEFTIVEKIENRAVRVAESYTSGILGQGTVLYITTPFRGLRYSWNFINNNSATNFVDLTTGKLQQAIQDSIDNTDTTTVKNLVLLGDNDWKDSTVTIVGNGTSAFGQKFKLIHSGVIKPLHRAGEFNDTLLGIQPPNLHPLKHVFKLEVNRDYSNPNDTQTILFDERDGNTVWFNRNYNAQNQNYSISNVVITRVSDSVSLSALEMSSVADVTFRVNNATATPFSNGNTKGLAAFWTLPSEDRFYISNINNTRTYLQNFTYDYALATNGGSTVNGVNNATGWQCIKELQITHVSNSAIDVRVRIELGNDVKNVLNQQAEQRYLIAFAVEQHTRNRANSDKVMLLVNINDFFLQLFDTELISNDTVFLQHRFSDVADGFASVDVFPTDDVVAYSQFNIDFNGLENDGINIVSVAHELVFKKSGFAEILVESNSVNTLSSVFLNGYVPLIDVEQNRAFKLSDGDFRKQITVDRDSANDSGTIFAYKSTYPFITRWEYWEALSGVNSPPSGVFDSTLPNNGINHYWHRYQTQGYTLNYRLRFTILQNGEQFTQEFDSPLVTRPFNDNAEWGNESIKSYDLSSVELVAGGVKFLQTGAKTKVVASFEKVSGTPPDIADVDIVFWGIVKEKGTIQSVVRYSSVYSNNGSTWFSSTDNSNLVVKSKVGAVYTGEVLVDNTLLPSASDFTIYARLYDAPPFGCPSNGIATESPECILTEDNFNLITEA